MKINLKVILHGTICNDDCLRNTALQCWNNVVTIRNNAATLCFAKNRRCESSRVTPPLQAWSTLQDTSTDITNEYRATHTTVSCNDCGGQSTVMKKDAPTSLSHSAFLFPCFHS